jgi:hypothetical protein
MISRREVLKAGAILAATVPLVTARSERSKTMGVIGNMYNCWWKVPPTYMPSDADIIALGGVVYGETVLPKYPQCPNAIIVTIGQDTSARAGWLNEIQDCESKFLTPQQVAANIAKHQAQGLGWGSVYNEVETLPSLVSAMGSLNYWLWLRRFSTTEPTAPTNGEVACQWCSVPVPAPIQQMGGIQKSAIFDPAWLIDYR